MALTQNFIALIFATSGSFCTALGLIIMKIANIKVEKDNNMIAVLQIEWLIGIFVMALGLTFNGCKCILNLLQNLYRCFEVRKYPSYFVYVLLYDHLQRPAQSNDPSGEVQVEARWGDHLFGGLWQHRGC